MTSPIPAIRIENLRHEYGKRTAIESLTFDVRPGEIFGLLGPNGGGKTTLFRILSTLMRPTGGEAAVFGAGVRSDPSAVRRNIGVVFQSPSLDGRLTVLENLWHQGHLYGLTGAELRGRIDTAMERFGIRDRSGDCVDTLSGGLKRRVEIAKGLLHSPRILLLDEPSTGIDPGARRDMWTVLRELRQKDGVTIVLTTHIMEEAEGCDRVAILHKGRLVALDTPAALRSSIPGEVVSIETENPSALAERIGSKFGVKPSVVDGSVRIEHREGHRFLASLLDAFPGDVGSVTVRKPTLEDVFVHQTGDRFWESAAEGEA